MITFRQYLESLVYRFDDKKIDKFKKNTYHRNKNWSSSGTFSSKKEIPSDWIEEKGLFAGELKDVISYCVPRKIKWLIAFLDSKKPTIFFDQKDKEEIENHVSYLSSFEKEKFEKLPSGEYFSKKPPKPLKQEIIENPIVLLKKHYNVKFVKNLLSSKKELERKNVNFNSEGF